MKLLFALALSLTTLGAQPAMQPFPMDWRDNSDGLVDVSFLLEKPAGKNGFIRAVNGHLVKPNGERFRIWGVNMTSAATMPSHEDAPVVAAHLARFGINCIRFHFLDSRAPGGLVAANRNDSRALDPERLDRLDFFIAELKKCGIYSDLNLNVGRKYKEGDGVRDYELIGFGKALTYFDERLIRLQREYARQLLTHHNPYTKSEYRNEPAVLLVEMVNENSIVESWFSDRLLGKATSKNPGTWTDIPASYEKQLTEEYELWLGRRFLPPVPRLTKKEFAGAPPNRFRTEAAFYMELEDNFFQSMRKYLKEALGVKSLLIGTSDHNHGASGYPLLHSTSKLDIVDGHVYWQHPKYFEDAQGKRTGFEIGNSPMVNDPLNSTVVQLSRSAVAGKPFTVSEVNHPFPSEYSCEGIPILTAYAAFQDWDGIFWYTFEHKDASEWKPQQPGYFEVRPDPVKMTELAAGALMFLRGDVTPAKATVKRSYSLDQVYESIRLPRTEGPYFTPGFPKATPLVHASRILSFDRPTAKFKPLPESDPYVSDTGEIKWHHSGKTGLVTLDTARSEAIVGFVGSRQLRNLSATVDNPFCAIMLSALDNAPLARSSKMLLTAGARVSNTGMKWNEKRNSLVDWGTAPAVIEPVAGAITLRNLEGAQKVEVVALNSGGHPLGAPVQAKKTAAGWEFPIGTSATTWYAITVAR